MSGMRRAPLPDDALDATDRAIINALQGEFPLTSRPFADAGKKLGLSEGELISRLKHLREQGAITRFGPFFDAEAMGGAFCLCAMAVPEDQFDTVLTKVNAHPEVAHNYERTHRLNMWFVLATEKKHQINKVAGDIETETELKVHLFPKLEEFYIGFRVNL